MKDFMIYIVAIGAITICCLLPLLIIGGAFSLLGVYFENNAMIILGISLILILIILALIKARK